MLNRLSAFLEIAFFYLSLPVNGFRSRNKLLTDPLRTSASNFPSQTCLKIQCKQIPNVWSSKIRLSQFSTLVIYLSFASQDCRKLFQPEKCVIQIRIDLIPCFFFLLSHFCLRIFDSRSRFETNSFVYFCVNYKPSHKLRNMRADLESAHYKVRSNATKL